MSTNLKTPANCPNCGKPLSAGALIGLCPACLLAQGAETEGGQPSGNVRFEPPPVSEISRLFPQLEILALIGAGGMGAVYKARQPALDRFVALKVLPASSARGASFEERFNREARALARLQHPNIVAVHEFGKAGPLHYFIMEFVDGANLRLLEQGSRLAPREALQIIPQICDALQYAHDEGVVHRDIKPENVLVDRKGRVKIADFGLAKILGVEADASRLTAEGQVMGTPHYMAPEQIEKPLSVDHRADIYSLGVVLYEMLTGDLPLGKFAPPSRKFQLDVRLDDVVLRALENDPSRRYQQASEVKSQVENIAGTPAPAAPSAPVTEQNFIRWAGFPLAVERDGVRKVNRREALKAFGILFGVLTVVFGLISLATGRTHFGWLGISGALSLQVRLLIAGIVTAFGVLWAWRVRPAPATPLQTPQGTVILPPERCSRKAVIGACWVPVFFLAAAMFFMTWTVPQPVGGIVQTTMPSVWLQVAMVVFVALPGFAAPLGTTLLGWLAVADIRRSRGRIFGLPLAVFDGLVFPLLALDLFLGLGLRNAFYWFTATQMEQTFQNPPPELVTFGVVMVCALVDLFVIRRVWRAVRLSAEVPHVSRDWWWSRRPGAVAIGLACVGLIMANVWRLEKSAPRDAVQQRLTAPDAHTGTFIAKLPGRGTVELLAVSDAGAASNAWWLPNGSLIPDTPYAFSNIGDVSSPGLTNKDFVLRWRDLPVDADGPEIEFAESGGTSSGGQVWRNWESYWGTWPLRAAFPPTATKATLRVGFDFANWQTVSVHDRNGNGSFLPTPPGLSRFQSQVHQVGENRGEAQLTLVLPEKSRDWKVRVVAVDTNGVMHARHRGTGTPAIKASVQTYEFMELPLARVREFQVQVRPVHWIEFRGVALQGKGLVKRVPDAPTDVVWTNTLSPTPRVRSDYSGARELLDQKPELRFLAWQDEWNTNNFRAARHADGMAVTNETEARLVRSFSPASLNVDATEAGRRHPRFLHVWFSHPLFNRHGFVQVAMLDESGQEIPLAGGGATSNDARAQDGSPGSVGWLIATFSPGDRDRIPSRLTLRLRYTVGALERVQTLDADYRGGMSLEGNSQFNGLGQDAEGNTFLAIAVDTGKTRERQIGVVAVLRNGIERDCRGILTMGNDGSGTRAERFVFDEPLAEIASFRIGSRPVRSLTWENVVLLNAGP